jgi:hypothetical protein
MYLAHLECAAFGTFLGLTGMISRRPYHAFQKLTLHPTEVESYDQTLNLSTQQMNENYPLCSTEMQQHFRVYIRDFRKLSIVELFLQLHFYP